MTTLSEKTRQAKVALQRQRFFSRYPEEDHPRIIEYVSGTRPSPPTLTFICKCGRQETSEWRARRAKHGLICMPCLLPKIAKQRVVDKPHTLPPSSRKFTTEAVKAMFIERGAQPTFDEYANPNDQLSFICACGTPSEMSFRNLHYYPPANELYTIPRCPKCRNDFRSRMGKEHGAKHFPHPTGADHPQWNPELTDEDRQLARYGRGPEMKRWYADVIRRANYTCQVTGARHCELAAHHIRWYSRHPELRLEPTNGICISKALHDEFHRRYKNPDDEAAAFEEFIKDAFCQSLVAANQPI